MPPAQHDALEARNPGRRTAGEPGADDDVQAVAAQPVDHHDDVGDPVLTVGVERDEHRGAGLGAGVLDAGLRGRRPDRGSPGA